MGRCRASLFDPQLLKKAHLLVVAGRSMDTILERGKKTRARCRGGRRDEPDDRVSLSCNQCGWRRIPARVVRGDAVASFGIVDSTGT